MATGSAASPVSHQRMLLEAADATSVYQGARPHRSEAIWLSLKGNAACEREATRSSPDLHSETGPSGTRRDASRGSSTSHQHGRRLERLRRLLRLALFEAITKGRGGHEAGHSGSKAVHPDTAVLGRSGFPPSRRYRTLYECLTGRTYGERRVLPLSRRLAHRLLSTT